MHNPASNPFNKRFRSLTMLKFIRIFLGSIIYFISLLTRGRQLKRSNDEQEKVEKELNNLSIYQFKLCPFCIKTRRNLYRLNLPIKYFDAMNDSDSRQELLEQGGKVQVPCLRIVEGEQVSWLYESSDIINYMHERFVKAA